MKAIVLKKYGPPQQVLSVEEVAKPSPKEHEVLVKVMATTINDYEWSVTRGKPYAYRIMFGFSKPKNRFIGMELAGVIEAVGTGVHHLNVGDEILSDTASYGFGTLAEYICLPQKAVTLKPSDISFEQAAALPHAGCLAYQGLYDAGQLKDGMKVLINGAAGGVGTLALQLAKMHHCHVTGVDSAAKASIMKSAGFDATLDYEKTDFTKTGETYDLVLDCKTSLPARSYFRALKANGRYVSIGGTVPSLLKVLFTGMISSAFTSKRLMILALKSNEKLPVLLALIQANKLQCLIDGPYTLAEVPTLVQYFGEGKHHGKIVVRV